MRLNSSVLYHYESRLKDFMRLWMLVMMAAIINLNPDKREGSGTIPGSFYNCIMFDLSNLLEVFHIGTRVSLSFIPFLQVFPELPNQSEEAVCCHKQVTGFVCLIGYFH